MVSIVICYMQIFIYLQGFHYSCVLLIATYLPHKVKTQYVQISNIVDTSFKHQIFCQSTSMVKGCMYICLIDLPLVMEEYWWLIVCLFRQEFSMAKESTLRVI